MTIRTIRQPVMEKGQANRNASFQVSNAEIARPSRNAQFLIFHTWSVGLHAKNANRHVKELKKSVFNDRMPLT